MQYIQLQETELMVSRICVGCMSFGERSYLPWALDECAARRVLFEALDCGINFFDTADIYSNGRSEEIVGRILRDTSARELVIATKCGCVPNGRGRKLTAAHIQNSCELSLRRLGIETIDLYQIHRLDGVTPLEESLQALYNLMSSGKVRHIGISSVTPQELDNLLMLSQSLDCKISTIQNHFNLLYRKEEEYIIPSCQKNGISVIPYSPLARGLLARNDSVITSRFLNDNYAQRTYSCAPLMHTLQGIDRIAHQQRWTRAEVSLAWVLSKPFVSSCVVGPTTPSQVTAASRATGLCLTVSEIESLDSVTKAEHSARA